MKRPAPLTNREEELIELRKSEIGSISEVSIDTKHKTLSGIAFPISESAKKAIIDIGQNVVDYVQLKIGKLILFEIFQAYKKSINNSN